MFVPIWILVAVAIFFTWRYRAHIFTALLGSAEKSDYDKRIDAIYEKAGVTRPEEP